MVSIEAGYADRRKGGVEAGGLDRGPLCSDFSWDDLGALAVFFQPVTGASPG
jgi:hypothetical protein